MNSSNITQMRRYGKRDRGIELYKIPSEGSEQSHGPGTKKQERLPDPKLVRQLTALYS
jgi:hypothetical protein